MFYKKYKNRGIIIVLFFIMLSLFVFSPIIIASFFLPETIHLIEGKEEIFDFKVPVIAAFNEKTAQDFRINESTNNSAINLNNKFSVVSDKIGDTEVTLNLLGVLPVKKVTLTTIPDIDVIPCGKAVGVRINTDGIMVLGGGQVENENNEEFEPSKNILKAGDLILSADNTPIDSKEQLIGLIEDSGGKDIKLKIKRNGETLETSVKSVKSKSEGVYKLGIWVRDSTQGIGTITYYNPNSLKFGALGHGITDVDTKKIMSIKNGVIMDSSITSSKVGKKGIPGELLGNIDNENVIGKITANTPYGIYGYIEKSKINDFNDEKMKIGLQNEVTVGEAYILSTIDGSVPKKYKVQIESTNKYSNDNSKGMIVKITDDELLSKTKGIIQGMSGSPIIQNDKLIGAITHVFVQDPSKGYGIFIENMLKQEENL